VASLFAARFRVWIQSSYADRRAQAKIIVDRAVSSEYSATSLAATRIITR